MPTLDQRDSLEALHPLPRAIARELATVPGLWVSSLAARFPEEPPDLVRLAIATLLDTGVAWAPAPGRIALNGWACEALRSPAPREANPLDEPVPYVITNAGRAALAGLASRTWR